MIHLTDQTFRITIIGASIFGRENLSRFPVREYVIIAETVASSEAVAALKWLFSDPLQLFEEVWPDGIIVTTSAAKQYAIASAARFLDILVLLEKPVLERAAKTGKLNALTHGRHAYTLPMQLLQFSACHAQLCHVVKPDPVGDVVYVSSRRYRDDVHMERYSDTDPVLVMLIQDIDLALRFSPIPFVTARAATAKGPASGR